MALDPITEGHKLSFLNPRMISGVFIGSDIISFLIQSAGSGFIASDNISTIKIGLNIIFAGMAINLASFTLFISVVAYFDVKTREAYRTKGLSRRYYPIVCAVYTSWCFIMVLSFESGPHLCQIRSIFRIVEFAFGWEGPVNTNEIYFFVFDSSTMHALCKGDLTVGFSLLQCSYYFSLDVMAF